MADYTFAGVPTVAGNLVLPLCGLGTAEVYFADPDDAPAVGTAGDLTILGAARRCVVVASGGDGGHARARLVTGAGKMDAELPPQDYRGYAAGDIAVDCLAEAGEVPGAGWSALSASCQHWTRPRGPCREALRRLVRLTDDRSLGPGDVGALHWRTAADGSVALVSETWAALAGAVDRDAFAWPQEGLVQFYPASGAVEPGRSVECFGTARRLQRVEYRWAPSEVTCRGWY